MALRVDYSPVGALMSLASAAGRAQQQPVYAQDVSLSQAGGIGPMQAQTSDHAFSLQRAMADRIAAAQLRTPAADHIAERADLSRKRRVEEQKQYKDQLDEMLSAGTIDQTQYQKAIIAVLTGNDSLLTEVLKQPKAPKPEKPNISNSQEVSLIREKYREQRRMASEELARVDKDLSSEFTATPEAKQKQADLKKQIAGLFDQEAADIEKWRKEGRGQEGEAETPQGKISMSVNGRPVEQTASLQPGMGSVTTLPSKSEQGIMDMARQMAGPGAAQIGMQPQTGTISGGAAPAPPAAQRIAGQSYTLPNGKIGIWRGTGWEVQ
jgi:hypothetical protein